MSAPLPYELAKDYDHAERLARGGDVRAALRTARAALEMARAAGDGAMVRRGLNTIAICQNAASRFIEAIAAATDAYQMSVAAQDLREATNALATLVGMTGFLYPLPDAGLSILDECLANALTIGDKTLEARVRMFRSMRLGVLGRFDESDTEFARIMALAATYDIKMPGSMLALNWLVLAMRVAIHQNNVHDAAWDTAMARYAESLDHARQEKNAMAEMRTEANLADIAFRRGLTDQAIAAVHRCQSIGTRLQQFHVMGDLQLMLAQHHDRRGSLDQAGAAYLEAYACAEQSLPNPCAAEAAAALARLADMRADDSEARVWRERERTHRATHDRERENARRELAAFFEAHQELHRGAPGA